MCAVWQEAEFSVLNFLFVFTHRQLCVHAYIINTLCYYYLWEKVKYRSCRVSLLGRQTGYAFASMFNVVVMCVLTHCKIINFAVLRRVL